VKKIKYHKKRGGRLKTTMSLEYITLTEHIEHMYEAINQLNDELYGVFDLSKYEKFTIEELKTETKAISLDLVEAESNVDRGGHTLCDYCEIASYACHGIKMCTNPDCDAEVCNKTWCDWTDEWKRTHFIKCSSKDCNETRHCGEDFSCNDNNYISECDQCRQMYCKSCKHTCLTLKKKIKIK
jgi:hypothetical protein